MQHFNTMTRSAPAFGQGATPRPIKLRPDPPTPAETLIKVEEELIWMFKQIMVGCKPPVDFSDITRDIARSTQS